MKNIGTYFLYFAAGIFSAVSAILFLKMSDDAAIQKQKSSQILVQPGAPVVYGNIQDFKLKDGTRCITWRENNAGGISCDFHGNREK